MPPPWNNQNDQYAVDGSTLLKKSDLCFVTGEYFHGRDNPRLSAR
jgi:hypothetical protein